MHGGRAFASASVTVLQGDRVSGRAVVLLSGDEADLIRHGAPAPDVPPPEDCPRWDGFHVGDQAEVKAGREMRLVEAFDPARPETVAPPRLRMWTRSPDLDGAPVTSQAFVGFVTAGPNIATAMLPHPGFGTAEAHESVSTGIMTHTLSYHEPFDARDWLLSVHESPYAGRGRAFARGDVFTADGRLVASFSQDSIIRPFPAAGTVSGHGRTVL
jgi:acyl-CoA thioesterase II